MNNLSNSQPVCKIKELCHKLGKIQLKTDYNVKFSLFKDEKADAPCCTHLFSGTSVCKAIKVLAVISIITLMISTLFELAFCPRRKR